MSPELESAIEHLYGTFNIYGLAAHVLGCPCCVTDADGEHLHSAPLRFMAADDLKHFAFSAMSTWGTADDLRHFLPRIFELLALDGGGIWIDPEVALGKLPYGQWRRWASVERLAIERYLNAMWSDVSRTPEHRFDFDDCLCSIAQAVDDLAPYLDLWRPDRSLGEASQFANWAWDATWANLRHVGGEWRLRGPWWDGRPHQAAQAASWLLSPARVAELESSFFTFAMDAETATAVSEAAGTLAAFRAANGKAPGS